MKTTHNDDLAFFRGVLYAVGLSIVLFAAIGALYAILEAL